MPIPRIYSESKLSPNSTIELSEASRRHVVQVLRLKQNDHLVLFDGNGGEFPATIDHIEKRSVTALITDRENPERESPLAIHLFQGISKGERMDYAIQKAVENGVREITPVFCERSVVKLDQKRLDKKTGHWRKVVISACEQCGRNIVPPVHAPVTLHKMLADNNSKQGFILDPKSRQRLSELPPPKPVTESIGIIVGPEGGLTDQEIISAHERGFHGVTMGPRILRTETASVVAITIMQTLWGDL
ncbi:MAG: 16S rRNA (uracil(1498)-N(3))-methyltransferase [Gammaproteobacteria bacterium]|uniref:Ribosomal RNA small subunit methyltransferase E n=1 Tax=Candidatus Thiopontia autotrophica TaxID=2841688 RepID=A0A8J6NX84_9GAMM|nr:16S rRNA (uracil(1498)-N(3))-methyltransferase [Candidatus Thiopontia autotrophica]MBL6969291.1 16S rRNA (uracil(1498)-N(3))-methyltransferase [Gammaproteobacteria bacterium]